MTNKGGYVHNAIFDDKSLIKFNPTCVDNFFSEPDKIRSFALSLKKEKDKNGSWPGVRSKPLYQIDNAFNKLFCMKVLSCYYDLRYVDVTWSTADVMFQQILPDQLNNTINEGWIHKDIGFDLAGLIYLTPNADLNSGTSLFNLKPKEEKNFLLYGLQSEKECYNEQKSNIKNYKKQLENNNNKFYEKTRFQNLYNRLIVYDSNEYHKANNLYAGKNVDDRLTLVFFISGINSTKTKYPIERIKDYENYDTAINYRIDFLKNEDIKSKTITPKETDISDK